MKICVLDMGAIGDRVGCAVAQTPKQRCAVTRKLGAVREIGQHLGLARLMAQIRGLL
ncbi:MAG: hypothetical protein JOY60_10820 [Burkholderiaceae bacterium]|nr:hypothetical protein [Burkholderiaceae bacterium]